MKKYGLIGKTLSYSFSKIIHEKLYELYNIDASYELIEVDEVSLTLLQKYDGVNITIPYKQEVIQYLQKNHCPFPSCNTVKNDDGILSGYNTDIYGFDLMLQKLELQNIEKVVILGSGASSKMLQYYFKDKEVIVISRQSEVHNYQSLTNIKADILINATPVGMAEYKSPVPEQIVSNYRAVLDLNYNPQNSELAHFCQRQEMPFINGLYMLIAQAIKAFEIWNGIVVDESTFDDIYKDLSFLISSKIAIVGMPLSGKTTLIRKLNGVDLDDVIEEQTKKSIPELLEQGIFRDEETNTLKSIVSQGANLVALGGGAVLKQENIELLQDYLVVFLNTPIETLKERARTNFRPLIKKEEDLLRLYEQRYPIYCRVSNISLTADSLERYLKAKQEN